MTSGTVCFYQDTYLVRKDLAGQVLSASVDPITLYQDGYNFMPVPFRNDLMAMRASSTVIREIETRHFGYFRADPLAYRPRGAAPATV